MLGGLGLIYFQSLLLGVPSGLSASDREEKRWRGGVSGVDELRSHMSSHYNAGPDGVLWPHNAHSAAD